MIRVPVRGDLPWYDLQVTLDDVTYTLEFRWNVRASAWFMDILTEDGETLIRGSIRLVVDFPLVPYWIGRTPPGVFVAVDTTSQSREIDRMEDLGGRVVLTYVTAAELG